MAYLSADDRRNSIIDAAIDVIASEGFAKATTRRIAERADAPLGALHYCFRNKAELMELVLLRAAATMGASFGGVDPKRGLEATIRDSVAAYWKWVRENLGLHLACMELLMWMIRGEKRGRDLYSTVNDPYGGDLLRTNLRLAIQADTVTPAVAVDEIARFIIHRFDGLVLEYAQSDDRAACQRQTELLADALVAIAVPPGGSSQRRQAKALKPTVKRTTTRPGIKAGAAR